MKPTDRNDFDTFCRLQRQRIKGHRSAFGDATDPTSKAKKLYPITRRGVGGGGGLPYGTRKISID